MKLSQLGFRGAALLLAATALHTTTLAANSVTLLATPAGDAAYAWNSKYGPYGYTQGGTELGVGLYMGAPYGNDYTMGIIELPIAGLAGGDLIGAKLQVESTGFDTGYYYGSAGLSWLNVGATPVTGNPVADALGLLLGTPQITWLLWPNSAQGPGVFSFDVTSAVQQDLDAGRAFSTFVLAGSRDTYGSIYAAESGKGARLLALTTAPVPEPATWALMLAGLGLAGAAARRRTH